MLPWCESGRLWFCILLLGCSLDKVIVRIFCHEGNVIDTAFCCLSVVTYVFTRP